MKDFFVPEDLLLFSNNMGMNSDFSVRGFSAGVGEAMATLTVTVSAASPSGITFVGSSYAQAPSAGVASYTVPMPEGIQAGDILLVVTGFHGDADLNPGVITPGWTEVLDLYANDNRDANLSLSWAVVEGVPQTDITVYGSGSGSNNGAATVVHAWRGVDNTEPFDVVQSATGKDSAHANPPSITPLSSGAVVVHGVGCTQVNTITLTAPAGSEHVVTAVQILSLWGYAVGIAQIPWESGPIDPPAWTPGGSSASESWAAFTVALKPA